MFWIEIFILVFKIRFWLSFATITTLVFACFAYTTATTIAAEGVYKYYTEDSWYYFPNHRSLLAAFVFFLALVHKVFVLVWHSFIIVVLSKICNPIGCCILVIYCLIQSCFCCYICCSVYWYYNVRLIWLCTTSASSFSFEAPNSLLFYSSLFGVIVLLCANLSYWTSIRVRVSLAQVCNLLLLVLKDAEDWHHKGHRKN